ncbi:C6 zinc finger domain protein [Aspergillus luchuensis]|uniref:C6 zinc finger domain protein n=1 Tax=Aspergillus kawachii TaxID=1069201 RepID=A0A146F8M4_ASPKA|nr:C6 zinc finger domain protein [Aspergillus luchuensis]
MSHPEYLFTYCNAALVTTRTKASTSPLSIPSEMRKKGSESSAMVGLADIRETDILVAQQIPNAWFPADAVTTDCAFVSSVAFKAPQNLKEPEEFNVTEADIPSSNKTLVTDPIFVA